MNVTELLLEVGDVLEDTAANDNYPEAQILRYADRIIAQMFRKMAEVDEGYWDCDLNLLTANWKQVYSQVFDQRLPEWVYRIVSAQRIGTVGATPGSTPSPWVGGDAQTDDALLTPRTKNITQPGYEFHAGNVLRLFKFAEGLDVHLVVQKKPAPLIRHTLTDDGDSTTVFHLPQTTPTLGRLALEEGWYRNERFEVKSTQEPDETMHKVVGAQRRVVQSEPDQTKSSKNQTKLTFDVAWPDTLESGDVIESVIPIPDEHTRLLVLLIANAGFGKKNNTAGQKAIAPELSLELDAFKTSIQPRQQQEPDFYRSHTVRTQRDFTGKDPAFDLFEGF